MDVACATLAFIDGVGTPEMMLIFVIVLVLFGGQKLPEFARGLGKTIREFKKAASGVEDEFKRALEEDERRQAAAQLPAPSTTSTTTPAATDPGGPDPTNYHPDEYHHDYHEDETYGGDTGTNPTPATTPGAASEAGPGSTVPAESATASPTPPPIAPATPAVPTPTPDLPVNTTAPASPAAPAPAPATPPASGKQPAP